MNQASLSMKVFGAYASLTGFGLLLVPDLFLAPLGLPAPTEVWIRVLGALAIVLGYYYWVCGAAGALAFIRASVVGRIAFAVICVLLVLSGKGPIQLLLFGGVDFVAAVWTAVALKQKAGAV